MSSVSPATAVPPGGPTDSTQRKNTLTQADFMKIFTKQLQYQNPLEPMDNFQMATQMSQFSQVDSLNTLVKSIKSLESYQASVNSLQTVGLIGKKVEAAGNTLSVDQGKVSEGYYQLEKPGKVNIGLFDANGKLVRVLQAGMKDVSKQGFTWDGKNQQGVSVPAGNYTFQVTALDESNQSIAVKTSRVGLVTGIAFEDGITQIQMGKDRVTVSDIKSILS